jgi:hypothetical protein
MVMFTKKKQNKVRPKRVTKMEDRELSAWFDTLIMYLGQSFDAWRYHAGPIDEVEMHLETMLALIEEIKDRGVAS